VVGVGGAVVLVATVVVVTAVPDPPVEIVVVVVLPGHNGHESKAWLCFSHSDAGAGADVPAGTVTVIDCGEPVNVVWALPAVSATENEAAAVNVDVTAPPPAVAVEVAVIVHTVPDV